MNKKITLYSEAVYFFAILTLAFAVATVTTADFGVSMIVAPAYILSCKIPFLSFGLSEYVLQAIVFVILCIVLKKVRIIYLCSFLNCIIYGAVLDLFRTIIPLYNPNITVAADISMPIRIALFVFGVLLTSFSIALFFRTYLYPQVYDFFVKAVSEHFNIDRMKFKTFFDVSFLVIACIMTLVFFGKFVGIGIGTVIMTVFNGFIIDRFGRLIDKFFVFKPAFKGLAEYFEK